MLESIAISIKRNTWADRWKAAVGIIDMKAVKSCPILANARLRIKDGLLSLMAASFESAVEFFGEHGNRELEREFLLPAQLSGKVFARLPENDVTLSLEGEQGATDYKASFESGKARSKLNINWYENTSFFNKVADWKAENPLTFEIDVEELAGASRIAYAARYTIDPKDHKSYGYKDHLKGICIDFRDDGSVYIAGTCGFSLHYVKLKAEHVTQAGKGKMFNLTAETSKRLCDMASWGKGKVKVACGTNGIVEVACDHFRYLGKTFDAPFPNYMRVIPDSLPVEVTVDMSKLKPAISQMTLVSELVVFNFGKNGLKLSAFDTSTSSVASVTLDSVKSDYEKSFIVDMTVTNLTLSHIKDEVTFKFSKSENDYRIMLESKTFNALIMTKHKAGEMNVDELERRIDLLMSDGKSRKTKAKKEEKTPEPEAVEPEDPVSEPAGEEVAPVPDAVAASEPIPEPVAEAVPEPVPEAVAVKDVVASDSEFIKSHIIVGRSHL